jgi:hypothetical protein
MDNATNTLSSKDRTFTTWSHNDKWILIHTLKRAKEEGKWGNNNPKEVAWKSYVIALFGSKKVSGRGGKECKGHQK